MSILEFPYAACRTMLYYGLEHPQVQMWKVYFPHIGASHVLENLVLLVHRLADRILDWRIRFPCPGCGGYS